MAKINVENGFNEAIAEIELLPKTLTRTGEIAEMAVKAVTAPVAFEGETLPEFLQGKHYCIVSGDDLVSSDQVSVSVLAEQMKAAWNDAGIEVTVLANNKENLPSCNFSANGYEQAWKLV